MRYYIELMSFYARLYLSYFMVVCIRIVSVPVIVSNLLFRLEWLISILAGSERYAARIIRLRPAGPTFKAAVRFWRKEIKTSLDCQNHEVVNIRRHALIAHLANKPLDYVGWKYLRANSYVGNKLKRIIS